MHQGRRFDPSTNYELFDESELKSPKSRILSRWLVCLSIPSLTRYIWFWHIVFARVTKSAQNPFLFSYIWFKEQTITFIIGIALSTRKCSIPTLFRQDLVYYVSKTHSGRVMSQEINSLELSLLIREYTTNLRSKKLKLTPEWIFNRPIVGQF